MATPTSPTTAMARFSFFALVQSSRQGIMRSQVDEVAALVGLTDKEMAYALNRDAQKFAPAQR